MSETPCTVGLTPPPYEDCQIRYGTFGFESDAAIWTSNDGPKPASAYVPVASASVSSAGPFDGDGDGDGDGDAVPSGGNASNLEPTVFGTELVHPDELQEGRYEGARVILVYRDDALELEFASGPRGYLGFQPEALHISEEQFLTAAKEHGIEVVGSRKLLEFFETYEDLLEVVDEGVLAGVENTQFWFVDTSEAAVFEFPYRTDSNGAFMAISTEPPSKSAILLVNEDMQLISAGPLEASFLK